MTAFSSQVDSGVGHLVFNKPPVNAFDSSEWAAIAAEIRALGQRNDVHVLSSVLKAGRKPGGYQGTGRPSRAHRAGEQRQLRHL